MRKITANTEVPISKNAAPEEAIEFFFRKHYVSLCRGVYRLLRDEALAEDLVQEVFIKIWEKKDRLKFDERFIYYLKKSCYHAALAELARKLDPPAAVPELPGDSSDHADTPSLKDELEAAIHQSINLLPEKTRLIFTLSRYEEMTYRQIADQLNISVKAIEKHMGNALRSLRESLKEYLICMIFFTFI